MENNEKPPPGTTTLRKSLTARVCSSVNIRCASWLRTMADIQHLSNPDLASRLRNDLALLDSFRQRG